MAAFKNTSAEILIFFFFFFLPNVISERLQGCAYLLCEMMGEQTEDALFHTSREDFCVCETV